MIRKNKQKGETLSKVEGLFIEYAQSHQNPTNVLIHWICVPLITFSLLGLVWMIPFPHISWLGSMNGFVNWASFLIACVIYYYLQLSPTLSYGMLAVVGIFSFFIVQLECWEAPGGMPVWLVCAIIFVISWIAQCIGPKIEGRKPSFLTDLQFLLIGPIWLLSKFYRKLNIPY